MKTDLIKSIIALRAAVSFLGEKKAWWNSEFHKASAEEFLKWVFPKLTNSQFSCSNIVTRNFTDNEVGANYYHLFRLPMSIEELINNTEKSMAIHSFESEEQALKSLKELSLDLATDRRDGPKNIGSADKMDGDLLQVFAAEYRYAFENDYKVHPYLN
jgi:hypothetical protein